MEVQEANRNFWICFMFMLIFLILGIAAFSRLPASNAMFLFGVWFLQLFLILLFSYYALLKHPENLVLIYILFFLTLLFSTIWIIELTTNLQFSNMSLIIALIFTMALLYLAPIKFQILGVFSILIWLFLFYYININSIELVN